MPSAVTVGSVAAIWLREPLPVLIIGLIFSALAWYGYMSIPYQFDYEPGKFISFRSVRRTVRIAFQEIKSLDCRKWNSGFVFIRHASGSIVIFRNMPGLKELMEEIQRFAPSVEIRGRI